MDELQERIRELMAASTSGIWWNIQDNASCCQAGQIDPLGHGRARDAPLLSCTGAWWENTGLKSACHPKTQTTEAYHLRKLLC